MHDRIETEHDGANASNSGCSLRLLPSVGVITAGLFMLTRQTASSHSIPFPFIPREPLQRHQDVHRHYPHPRLQPQTQNGIFHQAS